jgi:hypothetical protein
MLTSGVVLLENNERAQTLLPLEHFNWELFDHIPYNLGLALKDHRLFTYLKNWLRSQRFKNYEFVEGVKKWQSSQAADCLTVIQDLLPYTTSSSVPVVTALTSSLSM